ncbi:hypothetical protein UlMin_022971 [Ulmus minor]
MDWSRGRIIGRGSSATVSVATSSSSGQLFAVKSAELSQSDSLKREQKILSSLSNSNIVSYLGHDVTTEKDKSWFNLFVEYLPGGSLVDEIRSRGGRIEESLIGYYTGKIVQGLDYLHSIGLVHCDIKGRNILVGEEGPKIADFGCAKWVDLENSPATISGTPMFIAPEAARGEEQGFASDIWSLGCTIIEMATGGPPWKNVSDPVSVLYQIAYSGKLPEFPSFLSDQAKDFLGKCLRRNPEDRWTASQLLKHPFIGEFSSIKQVMESNSCSPTSILDQGIWNLMEEESEILGNFSSTSTVDSASDRIKRLSFISGEEPSWSFDQSWITIRENKNALIGNNGEVEVEVGIVGGSYGASVSCNMEMEKLKSPIGKGVFFNCLDSISSDKTRAINLDNIALSDSILERDKDKLLPPFLSIFLRQ